MDLYHACNREHSTALCRHSNHPKGHAELRDTWGVNNELHTRLSWKIFLFASFNTSFSLCHLAFPFRFRFPFRLASSTSSPLSRLPARADTELSQRAFRTAMHGTRRAPTSPTKILAPQSARTTGTPLTPSSSPPPPPMPNAAAPVAVPARKRAARCPTSQNQAVSQAPTRAA